MIRTRYSPPAGDSVPPSPRGEGPSPKSRRPGPAWRGLPAVLLVLAAVLTVSAEARILNTLTGWAEPDSGLSMDMQASVSHTSGNSDHLSLTAGGSAQLLTGPNRFRFLIGETYRELEGEKAAEDFKVHLRHNYRLTGVLHTLLFAQNQYNPFRRLRRRMLLGGGLRADVLRNSSCSAALGASAMLESEELTDSPGDGVSTSVRGSFFLSLVWRPAADASVDLSGFYQPQLADPGNRLMSASLNLEALLFGELALLSTAELEYDSDPAPGVETTDTSLSSGLKLSL